MPYTVLSLLFIPLHVSAHGGARAPRPRAAEGAGAGTLASHGLTPAGKEPAGTRGPEDTSARPAAPLSLREHPEACPEPGRSGGAAGRAPARQGSAEAAGAGAPPAPPLDDAPRSAASRDAGSQWAGRARSPRAGEEGGAPRPPRSGGAAARGGRGAERSGAGGGCASAAMPNKNKKEKVSRGVDRERPSSAERLWGAGPAGRRGLGWGAAAASGACSPALGEPREGQLRLRGGSLPHRCVPASAFPRLPGRGQLPAGPRPGVPRRGPGAVSPAAVGGRESVEGGRGFGVRGSAEGGDGKRVLSRGCLRRSGKGESCSGLARGRWGRDYFHREVGGSVPTAACPGTVLGSFAAA